jgi:hypothetical protein
MSKSAMLLFFASFVLTIATVSAAYADSKDKDKDKDKDVVMTFATLPAGAPGNPEGLGADESGNIYSASFDLNEAFGFPAPCVINGCALTAYNYIYTFGPDGQLKTATPMADFVIPLGVWAVGDLLYVNDVWNGDEMQYALPLTDTSVPLQTFHICGGFKAAFFDPPSFCALNANYLGPDGRIYMSDNGAGPTFVGGSTAFTHGRIWVLDPPTGASGMFFARSELDIDLNQVPPIGINPPFGVNGIAFGRHGDSHYHLYMDNMSTGAVYALSLQNCETACEPGDFSVVVPRDNGIIVGPDNMDFDEEGNLWVASGQNASVVGIDPAGKIFARVGSFGGLTADLAPIGLLQDSGVVFSHGKIYVGNEASQSLLPTGSVYWVAAGQARLFTVASFTPGHHGHHD